MEENFWSEYEGFQPLCIIFGVVCQVWKGNYASLEFEKRVHRGPARYYASFTISLKYFNFTRVHGGSTKGPPWNRRLPR